MKRKLGSRERKMVIGGGAFLGAVAFYFLFLGPFLKKRSALEEDLAGSYQQYREYMSILSNQDSYQKQLQSRKREMLAVSRLLLSGNTSSLAGSELSRKIRSFAEKAGLSITREGVTQAAAIDHHQEVSIEWNMSGDVAALQAFLEQIERDANLLIVQTLEVSAPTNMRRSFRKGSFPRGQTESDVLRVTMTVAGYIEAEAPEAGKPTGGRKPLEGGKLSVGEKR